MPIEFDSTRRWLELRLLLPGAIGPAFRALASKAGNSAWFTKAEIEPRVGGSLKFEFAPGVFSSGKVTAWEPPERLDYVEESWLEGAPPIVTELRFFEHSANSTLLRMRHILDAPSNQWDEHLAGFERGWLPHFEVLKLYLARHADQPAASCLQSAQTLEPLPQAWDRLTGALGLGVAKPGERLQVTLGEQRFEVEIESLSMSREQRSLIASLRTPAPGVLLLGLCQQRSATSANLSIYFYGDKAEALSEALREPVKALLQRPPASQSTM